MTASILLGNQFRFVEAKDAQRRIIKACTKCWFEKTTPEKHGWGDCSGFVKAVQRELLLPPFQGNANSIYDEVLLRSDWVVLGDGSKALEDAGAAANDGFLTIGVWQHPERDKSGHVAVVTAYLPLLGHKQEHHAIGAWGALGSVGSLLGKFSASFGKDKHAKIRYAKCSTPIIWGD